MTDGAILVEIRNVHKIIIGKPEGSYHLVDLVVCDNIKKEFYGNFLSVD